jgi:hypothetical protein
MFPGFNARVKQAALPKYTAMYDWQGKGTTKKRYVKGIYFVETGAATCSTLDLMISTRRVG